MTPPPFEQLDWGTVTWSATAWRLMGTGKMHHCTHEKLTGLDALMQLTFTKDWQLQV